MFIAIDHYLGAFCNLFCWNWLWDDVSETNIVKHVFVAEDSMCCSLVYIDAEKLNFNLAFKTSGVLQPIFFLKSAYYKLKRLNSLNTSTIKKMDLQSFCPSIYIKFTTG